MLVPDSGTLLDGLTLQEPITTPQPLVHLLLQIQERLVHPYWFSDRSPTITARQSAAIVAAMCVLWRWALHCPMMLA